jgi:peptidyl-prolyl cis-trans isomerase D
MLQAINDKAKGLVGGIIILFISVPFALWGIQEYIGGAEQPYAAKVNDVEISVSDYEEALARQRQRLQSIFGDQLPNDAAFEKRMKQQVVDQLVTQRLLEQLIVSTGYNIPDQTLAQKIQSLEAFQQDGQFITSTYKDVLRSQGMTASEFEQLFRRDLMMQQLQDGISKTAIVDRSSLVLIDRLQKQTRNVRYLLFKQSAYVPGVELSDNEVQQYYKENQDRYMHPEQVSVSYVELKPEHLAVEVPVDEEALRRQYDLYVASLAGNEQRKARHILLQVDADASEETRMAKQQQIQEILEKINNGTAFESIAEEVSEDPGSAAKGGDLGWVSKGMMVPEFDDALFQLKEGEVSDIISTSFGYHIIKLEDIKGETPVSFEKKKAELVRAARQEEMDNIFYERSELMATLAYENDQTLQPVVESLDLEIQKTDMFSRLSGQGIAQNEAVRKAAFKDSVLKEGRNSDIIELDKNHVVVLRIDQHQPARPKSLDEVRTQVELTLKSVKAKQLAQADALQALASLQQGADMTEFTKDTHVEYRALGDIQRDFADVDRRIVNSAFQMPKPAADKTAYESIELTSDVAVVAMSDVKEAGAEPAAEDLQAMQAEIQSVISNREMTAVLDYLRAQSEIVIAKDLF